MALPKRDYFYLPEVVQKLGISEFDLQYYMSHGHIMASVWINKNAFQNEMFDAFKACYAGGTLYLHEGYVTISPHVCREVLETGFAKAREAFLDDQITRLTLPADKPEILVRRSSLEISRWDYEFFVERYGDAPTERKSGGRPSIMPVIIEEYARRRAKGEAYKSRMREAQALHDWACIHHTIDTPPLRDSIRNALISYDGKKKGTT